MTAVNGSRGGSNVYRAQQASTTGLSTEQATQLWNKLVSEQLESKVTPGDANSKTYRKSMGDTYSKQFEERMAKDLQAFLKEKPNATEAEIREHFKKQASKHSSFFMLARSMDESFMQRIFNKAKEAQQDRWK